jgi:hypothetical protein
MANQVSVDISANVQGYQQGMSQATEATKKYSTETRKTKDYVVNLNAELKKAKKEAMSLAAGYAQLSAEEKKSQFGVEMKKQLDQAMESAAEFIDLQGDIREQMKNLASDTKALDMLAEGIGIVGDVVSASAGVFAQLTGNEEDAQRAVVMFTTAQSALGAVTKITNALQLQSNTMLGVQKVQTLAAAAATKIKTAAEGKSVVVTKAATVAQALFNKIAMMNPYVLLATAIIGVVGALGTFIAMTSKADDAQKDSNHTVEEAQRIQEAYYSALNDNLSETMTNYTKLQTEWKNLRTEGEKVQWIKDNQDEFHNLGIEVNNISDAENVLSQNTEAVKQAFIARAQAAALAAQAAAEFKEALEGTAETGSLHKADYYAKYGIDVSKQPVKEYGGVFGFGHARYEQTEDMTKEIRRQRLEAARKNAEALFDQQLKFENESQEKLAKAGVKTYNKERDKALKKSGGKTTPKKTTTKHEVKVEPKVDPKSLEAAEKALKQLEDKRTKLAFDDPELAEITKDIEYWKKEIEQRKIKLGIEVKPTITAKGELDQYEKVLNDAVSEAGSKLVMAQLKQEDVNKVLELEDAYQKALQALNAYEQTKTAWLEQPVAASGSKALGEALRGEVQHTIQAYSDAISTLQNDLMNNKESWFAMGSDGASTWDDYIAKIQEYKAELASLQEVYDEAMLTPQEKLQKKLEKTQESINSVGEAVQAAGELFSALGEAADNEGLQVAGIVAKAVATVALSYAQALASCRTWVDWLAFGLTGLGTMVAMISQIKSVSKFADGGIVGGNSRSGDQLYARVNSGEMILNDRQQKNLFNMIDSGRFPANGPQQVVVTGKIKGTDLLLVQKNTNKVLSKRGNTIIF